MTVFLVLLAIGLVLGLIWRIASRRREIPCPTWLGWLVELDNPFAKTNRASFVVQRLNLRPGMHVLDAGCGPGRVTIPIAKEIGPSGKITAMDMQAGMLQRVKVKAEAANLSNIHYLEAKLGDGKLEPGRYDRAILVTVLGEIPQQDLALKEVFDALKPGGILSVSEIIFDPHFQRKSTVLQVARSVGFQEIGTVGSFFAFNMLLAKPVI